MKQYYLRRNYLRKTLIKFQNFSMRKKILSARKHKNNFNLLNRPMCVVYLFYIHISLWGKAHDTPFFCCNSFFQLKL